MVRAGVLDKLGPNIAPTGPRCHVADAIAADQDARNEAAGIMDMSVLDENSGYRRG